MASKRRAAVSKIGRAQPKPKPLSPVVPPLDVGDATVAKLTYDILELHRASGMRAVAARAEMGRLLLKVRHRVEHGDWIRWLQRHAPFTRRTAARAIVLHQLKHTDPQRFARLAPLGISKANVLVTLPPDAVDHLLQGPHVVPSSGASKTVLAMTFAELMQVIAALDDDLYENAAELLVATYRRQVRAIIRTVRALVEDRDLIAEQDLADLYDDLVDATALLADAFSLDDG